MIHHHGCRKAVFAIALIVILFFISSSHQAPVIGIDLGSRWLKVGIAKAGSPIDLVLNEQSKRKTSNIIGFREKDRFVGEAAYTMVARFPEKMLRFMNFLLGKNYDLELQQTLARYNELMVPVSLVKNAERGTIDVKFSNKVVYSPEELLSMIFLYIKQLSDEVSKGVPVVDVVVSIPHYFNIAQRQAILDAATIAKVNILALMHDHTATALQYGIKNAKMIKEMTKERHIALFYDIGSIATTVSVAQYSPKNAKEAKSSLGNIKVLGYASDDHLGGVDFDGVLANHFAEKFVEKYKSDPRKENRPATRLFEESQKIKHILSANNDAHLSIESLQNDKDLSAKITREEFEKLSEDLLNRLVNPIKEALARANLTLEDVDSFELSGGSSRIPAVQDKLSKLLGSGRSLSYSLNADEAIAMGASFYGATLSPSFKVTAFKLVDTAPYEVDFALSGSEKNIALFNKQDEIDSKKTINVPRTEDFSVTLMYNPNSLPKGYTAEQAAFATYEITGVSKAMSNWTFEDERGKKKKVKATFKLNRNGLVELDSVTAILEETITVRVENDTLAADGNETKAEPVYKKDIRVTKVDLEFRQTDLSLVKRLTPEQLQASQEKVRSVEEFESLKRRISAARNTLESTLYATREKLIESSEKKAFYTTAEKNKINDALDKVEEWLGENYDDEDNVDPAQITVYKEKLATITDLTNPIYDRIAESKARKEALTYCKNIFNTTNYLIQNMKENLKHITDEERDELAAFVKETEKSALESLAKQDRAPLFEAPAILAADIQKECLKVTERALRLAKKPVPKPEPVTTNTTSTNDTTTIPPQQESTGENNQENKKDEL